MNQEYKDWLDLDMNNLDPMPVSTEQKLSIKRHVLSTNKGKKKPIYIRYFAAAVLIGMSIVTASFMTLPAIATQVPFIQSILTYFEDDSLPNTYDDLATIVNQVQSSNGIDVMIEHAVYDGTNILITYAIQTEAELGDSPRSEGFLEVEHSSGMGGTGSIEKINDTTFVGIEKATPHFDDGKSPEKIHIQWKPQAFKNYQTDTQFEGDWNFEFTLSRLPTNVQLLNQAIVQDGITLVMKSLEKSELATVIQYDFYVEKSILHDWPFVSIELIEVKDNLGNTYDINGNGGVSHDNGTSNEWRATIYSIDPRASSIILRPEIYYSLGSGKLLTSKKMDPITIELQ